MPDTTEGQQRYLQNRRARAKAYLGGACVRCGTTDALQFDHIDPAMKSIDVSLAIAKHWSWSRLVVELDKCQLLCGDHHLEKTKATNPKVVDHGGGASGKRHCPCDACRSRMAEYLRAWKQAAKERNDE